MNSIPTSSASSSVYGDYGFKSVHGPTQNHDEAALFDVLFTWQQGDDQTKLNAAFGQLEASAKGGNRDSIDMLTQLALRPDELGTRAERSLFVEFSAPSTGRGTVADDISKAALALHDSYTKAPVKFVDAQAKLTSPSLLLYMAGATANDGLQKQLSKEIFSESNVWGKNRFIEHDELACVVNLANQESSGAKCFNSPMGLMVNGVNVVADVISDMIGREGGIWPQFVPVNTGDHWVLLGIHKPEGSLKPEAFVFSSTKLSDEATKTALKDAAILAGADDVSFLDQDMQTNVPNGCGLFVASAIKSLAKSLNHDPEGVIKTFQQNASKMTPSACEDYNLSGRRQLFGSFLIDIR